MNFPRRQIRRRALARALAAMLIFQSVPAPLRAAAPNKVALVAGGEDAEALAGLRYELRRRLSAVADVLSPEAVDGMLDSGFAAAELPGNARNAGGLAAILNAYNDYRTDAATAAVRLEKFAAGLVAGEITEPEDAGLLKTALLSAAWLNFMSGDKAKSENQIRSVSDIVPASRIEWDAYPPAFRKFARSAAAREGGGDAVLEIVSAPDAVDVFVDGLPAGASPLSLSLPEGAHRVAWHAPGRRNVTRDIVLARGEHRTLRAKLRWEYRRTRNGRVPGGGTAEIAALAGKYGSLTQSDIVVLLSHDAGRTRARVYDARYAQLYEEISCPGASREKVADCLERGLSPRVAAPRSTYWSKGREKSLTLDARVASRGKKPLYRKAAFWAALGGIAAAGALAGVLASRGGEKAPSTGGIVLGF